MERKIQTSIERIDPAPGQRLLVISDIHGHFNCLVQLLKKLEYSGDDLLIIVGDLIDKGPESLRVVRYVMELARQHPVYVTMGNVDLGRLMQIWEDSPESDEGFTGFLRWSKEFWGGCLALDMLTELGIELSRVNGENAGEYKRLIRETFSEELEFLWSRPTILTAGEYLFVHGGVSTDDPEALAEAEIFSCLKNDNFLNQGYRFERYTVVTGHWPVCLYRTEREDVNPLADPKRRILCIDGGCGLKYAGQLNGVILPDCRAGLEEIKWESYDELPVVRALEDQEETPAGIHIQYLDSGVERLEEKDGIVTIRHLSSGKILELPENWIYRWGDGSLHCSDCCDSKLAVSAGDLLSVVYESRGRIYGKKRGQIGWYEGKVEPVD